MVIKHKYIKKGQEMKKIYRDIAESIKEAKKEFRKIPDVKEYGPEPRVSKMFELITAKIAYKISNIDQDFDMNEFIMWIEKRKGNELAHDRMTREKKEAKQDST